MAEQEPGAAPAAEVVTVPFFRGERAYLIGRVPRAAEPSSWVPLVLCIHDDDGELAVDAVLLDESDVRLLFSYTRSYFHVDAERPHDLVQFLKTLMPHKSRAEIYISLGYHKHGKTELYRHALRHLATSSDCYQLAEGIRGMVMTVFTMPSYPVVFKIIKDACDYPKQCTRREVIERYRLVFEHDRAGRLIDAQEYEFLVLDRGRFADELLSELLDLANSSVTVEGDRVIIKHCYAERRVIPLDLYLRQASPLAARAAVIDYGQAIKDLAITNLFPGDLLLKNFGVTRQNRVVFYDYDEVRLLTECRFLNIPETDDVRLGNGRRAVVRRWPRRRLSRGVYPLSRSEPGTQGLYSGAPRGPADARVLAATAMPFPGRRTVSRAARTPNPSGCRGGSSTSDSTTAGESTTATESSDGKVRTWDGRLPAA